MGQGGGQLCVNWPGHIIGHPHMVHRGPHGGGHGGRHGAHRGLGGQGPHGPGGHGPQLLHGQGGGQGGGHGGGRQGIHFFLLFLLHEDIVQLFTNHSLIQFAMK